MMRLRIPIAFALLSGVVGAVQSQEIVEILPPLPKQQAPRLDVQGDPLPVGAIMRLGSARWRPSGYIQYLAFAPDGKRLATWHEEHNTTAALTIWDVATGREFRRVEMPGLQILYWTWLTDGRGISVVRTSEGPFIWEFSDGNRAAPPHKPSTGPQVGKKEFPAPDDEDFSCFAVSPDGKHLAAGKSGNQPNKELDIVVWELATQTAVADLPKPRRLATAPNSCNDLFFTPDGSKLVVFGPPTEENKAKEFLVAVFDAAAGKE
ncbi:MAG: WD40 repeat domain-containing protein, partial [Gammaproteobacteria bacterium]